MPYKIDADVLRTVAREIVGLHLEGGQLITRATGTARGLTIHPGSFHIEYDRGAVVTTLPFAMVDTLLVSPEVESVRRSRVEFTKLVAKLFRRS
mgnify:CR=1 FL=1